MEDFKKHYTLNTNFQRIPEKNFWIELKELTNQYKALDLGQGFPDYESLPYMDEKIKETMKDSNLFLHQYTRSLGHLRLVNNLAKCYSTLLNREINPLNEVLITIGAYGSLFNSFFSFIEKDDEVILIEPFFDVFLPQSLLAGAKCVFVPLKPKKSSSTTSSTSSADWSWDLNELEAAFNSKTKLIVLNTPNNPLGKVYTKQELEQVALLCIKYNTLCISDEVYEHITYDRPHLRIASLPGMWERTVTIGSAGKAFSVTGVKIGWTLGPSQLLKLCAMAQTNINFCCPTFFQDVISRFFELENTRLDSPESYFKYISNELRPKRNRLAELLIDGKLTPVIPEGGYFMIADISKKAEANFETDENENKDYKFVKYLIKEQGLATIPVSAFYSDEHKHLGENYIRFCFFKDEKTLEKAGEKLKNFK